MRRVAWVLGWALLFPGSVRAQHAPRTEMSIGSSYLRAPRVGAGANPHRGIVSVPGNLTGRSALAGDGVPLAEPIALKISSGTLYGTLELPAGKPPFPVALIIAGSGHTDRDGNSATPQGKLNNNSNKMLAEALAARGIASLRYDKRGVGESAKAITKVEDTRFDDLIEDAVAWGKQLRSDRRFGPLVLLGHSEGSLIGMVASRQLAANGFVSIAGSGKPAGQIIREQLKPLPPELMKQAEEIIKGLEEGRTTENIPPSLPSSVKVLFRPSVQPYEISWFKYDPAKEIAKLKMPVLILQGSTDIQVSVEHAKLLANANPSAKLVIIEGMNHVLKEVPADPGKQLRSYSDPALPVSPQLVNEITGFIRPLK